MDETELTLSRALLLPQTVWRAAKVSLLIGTLLVVINQGDLILAGVWPPLWKILATYLVPYGVASYAAAAMACDHSVANASAPGKEGDAL